jgi:hypothetical protein
MKETLGDLEAKGRTQLTRNCSCSELKGSLDHPLERVLGGDGGSQKGQESQCGKRDVPSYW